MTREEIAALDAESERSDFPQDRLFRQTVTRMGPHVGFGRMAQIVSECWRANNPKHGGVLALCPTDGTLFCWDTREIISLGDPAEVE